jgi:phospholipase D-like protein
MPGMGELIVILMILGILGLWIWMIVDCATNEPDGGTKVAWLLVVILAGVFGALIYLIVRRPQRARAGRS